MTRPRSAVDERLATSLAQLGVMLRETRQPAVRRELRMVLRASLLTLLALYACGSHYRSSTGAFEISGAGAGLAPALLRQPVASNVRDLPLVEVPAKSVGRDVLVVLLTGDGGWAKFDRSVAAELSMRGLAVVGLNSRAYLSKGRTPDETAHDVIRVMRYYMDVWRRDSLVLLGYSRGADLAPFVASRLPSDLRSRVKLVAMVGLGTRANFRFHWMDLLTNRPRPDDLPTAPELERLRGMNLVCIYGTEESGSGCQAADSTLVHQVVREGGHRVTGNFARIADIIAGMVSP